MGIRCKQFIQYAFVKRSYCKTTLCPNQHECKLLIVGGGAGGCSVAWRFSRKLKDNDIILLEPSQVHYYQPLFTLVAAGIKRFDQCKRPQHSVIPKNVTWIKDQADDFDPCNCIVYTKRGHQIFYEYLVIAIGLRNEYDKITGLKQALDDPKSKVSTIYSSEYCRKTWSCIKKHKGGHAVFTFPQKVGKCSGAAQKIMYLADDYFRKQKVRSLTSIMYNTGSNALFGVPKYATALSKIVCDRNITVNYSVELVELTQKEAVFTEEGRKIITLPYNFLHVTPQMSPPACLSKCEELVTETGYLDVDKYTLQHKKYCNIYGIGDCTSTPNSKTAAAVAEQSYILEKNLTSTMEGKEPKTKYDGYGACPMLTSYKTGILAEFRYNKKPCETFPFNQSKERRLLYYLNTSVFPYMYWNKLIKGTWNGPSRLRKFLNPFGR